MDGPEETSGLSAALPETLSELFPAAQMGPPTILLERAPPWPLPARTFHKTGEAASPVNGSAMSPSTALSADAAFSAIDAEASSRSLSAAEAAIADALREIKPLAPVEISELVLPVPSARAKTDLGDTVPQRMFEPHFEVAPPVPAFEGLQVDPALRPDSPPVKATGAPDRNYWSILKSGVKLFAWIAIGWLAVVVALIVAYRFINPPASVLMFERWVTGQSVEQKWVPLGEISPNVVRAVLLSEDGRFCQHSGVDLDAIGEAIENSDGRSRGGSTISMQVVKNLFLWQSKSYIRKAIELPLAYLTEIIWSKRRIMEIYLNIAEWGPGIFGIGAAAGYHFQKQANALSVRDAARLAVALPNPLERNAGRPGPGLQRLANAIQVRMRLAPASQLSCVLSKRPY